MTEVEKLRSSMIEWNNTFPLDRLYRQKRNLLFNSPGHRALSQIDIYLDWLEDQIFAEHEAELIEADRKAAQYSKGIWLQEKQGDMTDADFDDIVF